jgi:hypothetical protein
MFRGCVLALDLASVSGYAWGKPGAIPKVGHQRFAKIGESRAAAYRRFTLWLDLFVSARKTDLIVFESPAVPTFMAGQSNINTVKLLIGLCEILEWWCHGKVELREASVGQVRAYFIGRNLKSAIAKPLTLQRCRERGWTVETSDEADAAALWAYQCAMLRPDVGTRETPLFSE